MVKSIRFPIIIPDVGSNGATLRISAWLAEAGEPIYSGDRIVELLTCGMTFDVPADSSGVLAEIVTPVHTEVAPGETVGWIQAEDE